MKSCIRNFWRGEDGPTAVEYAVMLGLIIVVAFAAIQTFGQSASSSFSNSQSQISSAMSGS